MSQDRKISPKELRFVQAYVRLGGMNGTQAAIAAGYGVSGAHVQAHRLLRRPHVLSAIKDETERGLRAGVAIGASVLEELAKTAASESVRLQAAQSLLDRGGMRLANISEHHHIIEDRRSDSELLDRINELSRELGIGAKVIPGESRRVDSAPALPLADHAAGAFPTVEIPEDAEALEGDFEPAGSQIRVTNLAGDDVTQ